MHCLICSGNLNLVFRDAEVAIEHCVPCDFYQAEHFQKSAMTPWEHSSLTEAFLSAVKKRRIVQAETILKNTPQDFLSKKVLDYSCGQGIFLSKLLEKGVDAVGCDYDLKPLQGTPLEKLSFQIQSWEVPKGQQFATISFLDVIEHHHSPQEFVKKLYDGGVESIICKVPLASGVLFKAAKIFAKFGMAGPLKSLFQVGDAFPHTVYFSKKSLNLCFKQAGYGVEAKKNLIEVGSELPQRMRFQQKNKLLALAGFLAGFCISLLSPICPETAVYFFRKA